MGKLRQFFQRKGSTGSIPRWAWKTSQLVRADKPHLTEQEIAQYLWVVRYSAMPPKSGEEAARFDLIEPSDITSLYSLCRWIAFVEMGVKSSDGSLFDDVCEVIESELERLDQA